jgi:O-antigen/teichoic acid export membrane protein/GT2 family glycosyltransferase
VLGLTVSVVICASSVDRWDDLKQAVISVGSQAADEIVLVVDHCAELLTQAGLLAQLLPWNIVVVPNRFGPGLAGARNTGVAVAQGDIVAFLDDRAAAGPGWLAALAGHYQDPRVLGVGGMVRPEWPDGRPSWFAPELDWVVGCSYRGMPAGSVAVRSFLAANMSFRGTVLEDCGGFSSTLAGAVAVPPGWEDTELCLRISSRHPEGILVYEPAAVVSHQVPGAQATRGYLRSACYAQGRSRALTARLAGPSSAFTPGRSYAGPGMPARIWRSLTHPAGGRLSGVMAALTMIIAAAITTAGHLAGTITARRAAAYPLPDGQPQTVPAAPPAPPDAAPDQPQAPPDAAADDTIQFRAVPAPAEPRAPPAAALDDTVQFDTIQFAAVNLTGWDGRRPTPDQLVTRREHAEPRRVDGSPQYDDGARSIVRKPLRTLRALRATLADPMLRNGHFLIASASVTQFIGVVYWIFVARLYPVAAVGRNSVAISVMLFLGGVAELNLMSTLVRFAPTSGQGTLRLIVRTYLTSISIGAVIGAIFAFLIPHVEPQLDFLRTSPYIAVWFVFSIAMCTIFVLEDSALTGVRAAWFVPLENAAFALLKLVLLIPFALLLPSSGIYISWTIAIVIIIIPTNIYLFARAVPRHVRKYPVTSPAPTFREIRAFLIPDSLAALFMLASTALLPLLILNRLGPTAAAHYALAWIIGYALFLFSLNMGSSLVVETAADQSRLRQLTWRSMTHLAKLLVPVVIVIVIAAPYILLAFGRGYAEADVTPLRLLALAALPTIITNTAISATRSQRKMRVVLGIQVAICALVWGLSATLIGRFGITGVAVAWLTAQTATALVLAVRPLSWMPSARSARPYEPSLGRPSPAPPRSRVPRRALLTAGGLLAALALVAGTLLITGVLRSGHPTDGRAAGSPSTSSPSRSGQPSNSSAAAIAQAISLTSSPPSTAVAGGTYTVKARGGGSGNPVTFSISSASGSVCSISGSTVTFKNPGTCVIDANQAGGAGYQAAPQAQQTVKVSASITQAISFTSSPPSTAVAGGTYTVTATGGGSGSPVTFSIDPASGSVCSISGSTVTFDNPGTCVIDANQAGGAGYQPAPQAQQTVTVE